MTAPDDALAPRWCGARRPSGLGEPCELHLGHTEDHLTTDHDTGRERRWTI
jgi:hypothetical protein